MRISSRYAVMKTATAKFPELLSEDPSVYGEKKNKINR